MNTKFFLRRFDNKEFKLIEVTEKGLKGVAKDGEIAVVPFVERTGIYSK